MPPPIPKTPGGMDVVDTASAAPGFKAAETVPASPQDALQRLLNGNQRFVANRLLEPNHSPERRAEISKSQQPFATIFGCVDSRVPPELRMHFPRRDDDTIPRPPTVPVRWLAWLRAEKVLIGRIAWVLVCMVIAGVGIALGRLLPLVTGVVFGGLIVRDIVKQRRAARE